MQKPAGSKIVAVILHVVLWIAIALSAILVALVDGLTLMPLAAKIIISLVTIVLFVLRWKLAGSSAAVGLVTLGLLLVGPLAVWMSHALAYTPAIRGADGKPLPGSIAVMEKVKLNGRNEWIIIRGEDQTKPVLLFVSGGPVGSELGWVKRFNAGLEKDFVVVVWEEPGGGKSYPAVNFKTIQVEDYVNDGLALSKLLRERFHQDKIFLAGHSWGTMLTVWMAQQHPEYYAAVVNVGQMVNPVENDLFGYQLSLDAARKAGDAKVVADLEKNGPPPYGYGGAFKYTAYLDNAYGANTLMEKESKDNPYRHEVFSSGINIPEYGLLDKAYWFLGLINGMNYIYSPQLDQVDLTTQATQLEVPIYFATGRHDYNAWFELTQRYHDVLQAPRKELVWFEDSGHSLNFTEPEKFMELMRRVLAENQP